MLQGKLTALSRPIAGFPSLFVTGRAGVDNGRKREEKAGGIRGWVGE